MSATTFCRAATPAQLAGLCPAIVPCIAQAGATGSAWTGLLLGLTGLAALGGLAISVILWLTRHDDRPIGPIPVPLDEPVTTGLLLGRPRRLGNGPLPVVLDDLSQPGKQRLA